MKTIKYVKCEVTGEFLPENEAELVTIKILKKKGVKFKIVSIDEPTHIVPNIGEKTVIEKVEDLKVENKTKLPDDIVGTINPDVTKVVKRAVKPLPPPPGMMGVFIGQDHPEFDSKGAKETRRV
jgi:hypothetical protein